MYEASATIAWSMLGPSFAQYERLWEEIQYILAALHTFSSSGIYMYGSLLEFADPSEQNESSIGVGTAEN